MDFHISFFSICTCLAPWLVYTYPSLDSLEFHLISRHLSSHLLNYRVQHDVLDSASVYSRSLDPDSRISPLFILYLFHNIMTSRSMIVIAKGKSYLA